MVSSVNAVSVVTSLVLRNASRRLVQPLASICLVSPAWAFLRAYASKSIAPTSTP
jgi:hypothetical protein